jgi:transcriptional regulator with XRE-family HTH domain
MSNTEEVVTIALEGVPSAPSKRFVRNKDVPRERELMRERMVSARVMNGLTAVEAAQRLGYKNSTQLSQIESGERKVPDDWKFLLNMSKAYSVSVDYLMGISPHPERDPVAAESFAMFRGFEQLVQSQVTAMTEAFVRYGSERAVARVDLQAVTVAAEAVNDALGRVQELNPAAWEELRAGTKLTAAVERLEAAMIPLKESSNRRALIEEHCLAIAKGKEGPLASFIPQLDLF